MSSSASDPGNTPNLPPTSSEAQARSDRSHGRELLDSVLRRTAENGSGGSLDPADRSAMEDVARRHRGESLAVEPVAAELVQSVLEAHFQGFNCPADSLKEMSQQIAAALLEDPVAGARLTKFWERLCEVQP